MFGKSLGGDPPVNRILQYFTQRTEMTRSGGQIGLEIETDFLLPDGRPIDEAISARLLASAPPTGSSLKLELGRQKLELNVGPKKSFSELWKVTQSSLDWLYGQARRYGAAPYFGPEIDWPEDLLFIQEERDELWAGIDGRPALEELCRCSAVQFTVDVNPADAIDWINRLHVERIHQVDYAANHRRMSTYITESKAAYKPDRYGGPQGFESLQHYVWELTQHEVVMHRGVPCWSPVDGVSDLDIDLYLRSVWWHYRLRRYGSKLALEIRPFSRRNDADIPRQWELVRQALGL